ncbi:TPA: AlpA family phage regulatory protein [Salmonella enterica subsp. houtenae serovar 43:z4,z32:-]|uniref:AlpA family phage regulatory protein n=1 Tax=Salmonella enterica subsp. houtenae serovar 45:g,z51:- TaxID=1967611 RepID=A0A753B0S4_SALHO|nr:AlpA family phage regulatory protein [Salmonella enterica]EEC0963257.1 AlpA family phage regulatory protein [Salmonella enterica subsp. enterica serovar Baguida]HAF0294595.1 AlpA family phage regulatory protein [Salmonella enterica subsp. houtenae serovar 43:z4,z32:-]AXD28282.1 AlpA family phage regulatory protein [Salmonella enterica]EAB6270842.1 AlpA family phage regulatory protein [Salmonella enterica subsp. houtenae]EAT1842281.1 AlpA family phage regulatory protein [Salmonella enterica]
MAAVVKKWEAKEFNPAFEHIRIGEVKKIIFRSQSFIYQEMGKGTFPAGVKLSPAITVWRKKDIEQWLIDSVKANGSGVVEGTSK